MVTKRLMLKLVFLLLAARGICQSAVEDGFQSERITSAHGLSSNIVLCFLQDRTGFLWIGTEDGLNRYDGRELKFSATVPAILPVWPIIP
jgi:ligand-binding sensor domain-containing protein